MGDGLKPRTVSSRAGSERARIRDEVRAARDGSADVLLEETIVADAGPDTGEIVEKPVDTPAAVPAGDGKSGNRSKPVEYDADRTDVTKLSWVSLKSMTVVSFIVSLFLNIVLFIVGWLAIIMLEKAGTLETVNGLLGSMMTIDAGSLVKMLGLVCIVLTVVLTILGVLYTLLFNAASLIVGGIGLQTRTYHDGERIKPFAS